MDKKWIKADKPIKEYSIGTKFQALGGGYWIRNEIGFKWCTGATFPSVGGDWNGMVCLPENYEFPKPTCMICGEECRTWEIVDTGDIESTNCEELWCYCKKCDTETFHKL